MANARKIDGNQQQIVKALRRIPGISVAITSKLGKGFPDIVVGYRQVNYMIELKDGSLPVSRRKLTPDEMEFFENWQGQIDVCNNLEGVLSVIGIK